MKAPDVGAKALNCNKNCSENWREACEIKRKCSHFTSNVTFCYLQFVEERGKPKYRRKTSRTKDENQQQINPRMTPSPAGIEPAQGTLVGGECSPHCGIPTIPSNFLLYYDLLVKLNEKQSRTKRDFGIFFFFNQT